MITTDPQDEIFDIVNEQDEIIGSATRAECHEQNLLHREIYIVVFNAKRELLLQKRSLTKDNNPGLWTLSATGHVDQGESTDTAAIRELKEEIGIDATPYFVSKEYMEDGLKRIFLYLYVTSHEGPFVLESTEVDQVQFFSKQALSLGMENQSLQLTANAIILTRRWINGEYGI